MAALVAIQEMLQGKRRGPTYSETDGPSPRRAPRTRTPGHPSPPQRLWRCPAGGVGGAPRPLHRRSRRPGKRRRCGTARCGTARYSRGGAEEAEARRSSARHSMAKSTRGARAGPARGANSRHRPTRQTRLGPSLGSKAPAAPRPLPLIGWRRGEGPPGHTHPRRWISGTRPLAGTALAHKSRGDGVAASGLRRREGDYACVVSGPGLAGPSRAEPNWGGPGRGGER